MRNSHPHKICHRITSMEHEVQICFVAVCELGIDFYVPVCVYTGTDGVVV